MDLMKDIYKKELRTRIAAWEGKKTDDFQYEPEPMMAPPEKPPPGEICPFSTT